MLAIFKREFKTFFTNVTGWLFLAALLFLYGLYFFVYNLRGGYPYVAYSLSSLEFIMLIIVPILTMRVLAEEKKAKTDQMFLTYPVALWKVVVGKFLSMAAVFSIGMLIICVTPLVLALYGTVPMGESYTAILGFWLYGLACLAIGEFISSLTENQIISAVLSFVALFLGYLMANLCTLISESGNVLTAILKCYDLYSRIGPFMAGTLDLCSIVYFLSIIGLALFLTTQVIQKRRYSVSAHGIKIGAFSISLIVVVIAAVWGINFGMSKLPTDTTSIDVTYSKMFSLTDETKDYLKSLDTDVTIYAWVDRDDADTSVAETLERYEDLSSRLQVKYMSPTDNPDFYKNYTDTEPTENSLFVVSDKRYRVISYDDIYEKSIDYTTYSQTIDAYDAEGQITSAIAYVTMEDVNLPVIYQIAGHNEYELPDTFTKAISKLNVTLDTLTLLKVDAVPDDAQMLIINGATADFSEDDVTKVETYLDNGGTVLFITSYDSGDQPNLDKLLAEYGIEKCDGIVMENNSQYLYGNAAYYLLPEVISNTYTDNIENGYVFAPYSSGFKTDSDNDAYDYMDILVTSDSAVSKTNLEGEITTSEYEDGDIEGPFDLAVSAMKTDEPGTLIAVGSIDIFTDEADSIVAGSNLNLFTGIIQKHITENEVELPVIESKAYTVDNLVLTSATGIIVGILIMIILPLVLTASGIVIWAMRRKL